MTKTWLRLCLLFSILNSCSVATAGTLSVDEIHHHLEVNEGKEVLVLIHGLRGTSETFEGVVEELQKSFTVLTYDQRGHGHTDEGDGMYSPEDLAHDLRVLITHYDLGLVHLLGHSFGAKVALAYQRLYPNEVLSIILEDMGVKRRDSEHTQAETLEYSRIQKSLYKEQFSSMEEVIQFLTEIYGEKSAEEYRRKIQEVADKKGNKYFKLMFRPHVATLFSYSCRKSDFTDVVETMSVPLLLLKAGRYSAVSSDDIEYLIKKAPEGKVSVMVIHGAKHNIHKSEPRQFVTQVVSFVQAAADHSKFETFDSKRSDSPTKCRSPRVQKYRSSDATSSPSECSSLRNSVEAISSSNNSSPESLTKVEVDQDLEDDENLMRVPAMAIFSDLD